MRRASSRPAVSARSRSPRSPRFRSKKSPRALPTHFTRASRPFRPGSPPRVPAQRRLAAGEFVGEGVVGTVFSPPCDPTGLDPPTAFVGKVQPLDDCVREFNAARVAAALSPEFGIFPVRPPRALAFKRAPEDDREDAMAMAFQHEQRLLKAGKPVTQPLGELVFERASKTLADVRLSPDAPVDVVRAHVACMRRFAESAAVLLAHGLYHRDLHAHNVMLLGSDAEPRAYKAIDLSFARVDASASASDAVVRQCGMLARVAFRGWGLDNERSVVQRMNWGARYRDLSLDGLRSFHELAERLDALGRDLLLLRD